MLSKADWNFARRRGTLAGVADGSYPPFVYRYAKPADYLRKIWIKTAADDDFQIETAEVGSVFYGNETTGLIEYISDTSENYDPANWPPNFTRAISVYLAIQIGPKIARAGDEQMAALYKKLDEAVTDGAAIEAVPTSDAVITANRLPVMRRALEIIGQEMAGSIAVHHHVDMMRRAMNRAWTDNLKFVLSAGLWDFASKRCVCTSSLAADALIPYDVVGGYVDGYSYGDPIPPTPGIIEGYSYGSPGSLEQIFVAGYEFGYPLPADFLHKNWIRGNVYDQEECDHQRVGMYMFTNRDPCIMEYVALSEISEDPTNWPAMFAEAVAMRLAYCVVPDLMIVNGPRGAKVDATRIRDRLEQQWMQQIIQARNHDAIQRQPKKVLPGNWARARMGAGYNLGTRRLR